MKKIIGLFIFLISFIYAADVKPFTYEGVQDQQAQYDYMLRYKLFGKEYFKLGGNNDIPDSSGWTGTANNFTSKDQVELGGPILAGGSISVGNGNKLTTGPIRATTFTMNNDNSSIFGGTMCLQNTNVEDKVRTVVARSGGEITDNCPDVPEAPINLSIPTITWPDTITQSITVGRREVKYIEIPEVETYDLYVNSITTGSSGEIYFRMRDGGTLTRIFVNGPINLSDHTKIKVVYKTDSTDYIVPQNKFRGNLLFYTNQDFKIENTDYTELQGTFITTQKATLVSNIEFAGQIIANELDIGYNFSGKNFRFVKFDPDTIDVKLDKYGGLKENDSTVVIPVELNDTTDINVYFTYCFDLKDGVTVEDFNIPPKFPICNKNESKRVVIPIGSKTTSDPIYVNVKKDTLKEPDDVLTLRISDITGAILPNGHVDGELKIKIIDATRSGFNTLYKYKVEENYTGVIDYFHMIDCPICQIRLDSAYEGRYKIEENPYGNTKLYLLELLDYEKIQSDTIKVTAYIGDIDVHTVNLPIEVIDVNEIPVTHDTTFYVLENSPIDSILGTLWYYDEDINPEYNQVIFKDYTSPNKCDAFSIDEYTGVITTNLTFDYEKDPHEIDAYFLVQDRWIRKDLAAPANVKFVIVDVDEAPEVTGGSYTIPENVIDTIGHVIAVDPEGKKLTYTITNKIPFKIDTNGVIINTQPFDYEQITNFVIKVEVSDGTNVVPVDVKVAVTDVNEPVHTKDTTFTVPEYKKGDIGKITAWDEDGKPVQFSVTDTVKYSIDKIGNLYLKTPYDYNKTKTDTVKVIVTDGKFYDTATVAINVTNVNDKPVLQENDSLFVPENCKNCVAGSVIATDKDNDPIKYDIIEKGFTIDSAGVIKVTEPLDYEKTKKVMITVTATEPTGAADTMTYVIKVFDVNERAWVNDTTFTVPENDTTSWKVTGGDEDGDTLKYTISDSLNYHITDDGIITLKKPFDYEKKNKDTVTVYVDDGRGSRDSAKIVINITDVPENVRITDIDDKPRQDTIRTNKPDHKIDYQECEGKKCKYNELPVETKRDTTVKVCNAKKTSCDSVVILYNDKPPVVIISKPDNTSDYIDYITIEEQKDDKIYINKKTNELTITVKDTVNNTKESFPITVKLDTVKNVSKEIKDYNYVINEKSATITEIGDGLAEMTEVIDGVKVTVLVDAKTHKRKDTTQTVSYTKKIDGKEVIISYKTDNLTGTRVSNYFVSYKADDATVVIYVLDDKKKIIKNKEGNIAYEIKYEYEDDYGNKATAKIDVVFDDIPPKVEILEPYNDITVNANFVNVKWTVNGEVQDTLTLQRLERGLNKVIRRYIDKAGNATSDTVFVFMKEAKDIDIELINPVTKIDQEKVDEYYKDHKYDRKNPATVTIIASDDSIPEPLGVGFKVDVRLPSASPTGGLATLDDISKNGQIPVDDKGNVVGASNISIPVEQYINEHCTDDFKKDYKKNGTKIPLYDVTYSLHLWIYTTTANYVNDFKVDYKLNDEDKVSSAGTVQMVIDWMSDEDGHVKAKNGHALGTGAYLVRLYSTSIAKHRCDYKEQKKGDKTIKKEYDLKNFGYKRPIK